MPDPLEYAHVDDVDVDDVDVDGDDVDDDEEGAGAYFCSASGYTGSSCRRQWGRGAASGYTGRSCRRQQKHCIKAYTPQSKGIYARTICTRMHIYITLPRRLGNLDCQRSKAPRKALNASYKRIHARTVCMHALYVLRSPKAYMHALYVRVYICGPYAAPMPPLCLYVRPQCGPYAAPVSVCVGVSQIYFS